MSYGSTIESLTVRLSNSKPLSIVIDRPPSKTRIPQNFSDFSEMLTHVILGNRLVLLARDFSIHVLPLMARCCLNNIALIPRLLQPFA